MHRLALALKFLIGDISQGGIKRAERCGLVSSILFASVFTAFGLYVLIKDLSNKTFSDRYQLVSNFILVSMYTVAIFMLNRVMNKVPGDFKKEKRSVNC